MTQVFLSYSTRDSEFVDQLAADLRAEEIVVWKAPDSILPGEEWVEAIQRGLATSSHFVLVKSPNAVASKWVKFEFNIALARHHDNTMTIIPIHHEPCDPPPFWMAFQHVNLRDDYTRGKMELIRRLNTERPENPPTPAPPETTTINVHIDGVELMRRLNAERPENPPTPAPPETTTINVHIDGNVSGVVNVAGRDVLHHGPDVGRPVAPNSIRYGSVIRLIHIATNRALHSHNLNYEHPNSSMQQQVTAFWGSDDNDYWIVKGPHNSAEEGFVE